MSAHCLITFASSLTTRSTHFRDGSFRRAICFLAMASKAMSGVNRPTRIPWMLRIANWISLRISFSSISILTISNGKRSWNRRLIRAPPLSSLVETSLAEDPSIDLSMSALNCVTILKTHKLLMDSISETYWRRAFVLRPGSFGWKFLYSATSFSIANIFFWRLSRSVGRVSRIWFVSCWFRVCCK